MFSKLLRVVFVVIVSLSLFTVIAETVSRASTNVTSDVFLPLVENGSGTLETVQTRGMLICGVNANLPGFGFRDGSGNFSGLDIDFCSAIAATVLGDKNAFEPRALTASERFPALQSGEVDVLIRNTTWTISRDTSLGLNFAPTTFYDGQGFMVRQDSGITTLEDFEGGTICVVAGTITEANLARVFTNRGINYSPLIFANYSDVIDAYDGGQCDGWTTDKAGLIANVLSLSNPDDHTILEETISREPLGPLVRHGDDKWFDVIKWTVFCTVLAEDLGVNSTNVDSMVSSEDPEIRRMLGIEGNLGQEMGLNNDFCYQAIKQNGNYEEIYNRNLGPTTQFGVPRGLNKLWSEGGILYSPPFR